MPRTRQPAQAENSQAYGEAGQQIAAQQAIPLPQVNSPAPGPPQAAPQGRMDPMAAAMAYEPGITPLGAGTQRPHEPVTAGLSTGPGPGPEVFNATGQAQRAVDTLTMMARITGDQRYAEMADDILRSGGLR